jgi:putative CocE/NonD family hydrolase
MNRIKGLALVIGAAAMLSLGTLAVTATSEAATTKPAFGNYHPAVLYPETVSQSFYLPMRDGVRLAVEITRPAQGGKALAGRFPVIWHAALDIGDGGGPKIRDFAKYGYVVAVVARRGNGASFGVRRGYEDSTEAFDHYEVIEWLARQSWSTGKVGMYGCSNTGEAVLHAVKMRPPHLTAAFAGCFSFDRFDGHTRGGIIANYGTGPTRTIEEDMKAKPVESDKDLTLLRQAATEHLKSTDLFALMKSMPFRDSFSPLVMSRFWGEVSMNGMLDNLRASHVPLYIQGGWHDDFREQGLLTLANLPGQTRMLIGPWRHCRSDGFEIQSEILRFFDHYLKGKDTGITKDAPLHYYTIGAPAGHEWRTAATWPLAGTKTTNWFLSGETLSTAMPGAQGAARKFTADYKALCPPDPEGGGPFTQPCHPATGSIVYAAPTLAADTEVTGHPIADLWIASNGDDANVFAYLEDVAPNGSITVITEGRQKASLRKVVDTPWNNLGLPWRRAYAEDEQRLKPGEAVQVRFDLLPTSYVFKAGHRLQIAVAGSDPRERDRIPTPPQITVLSDATHASSISIPTR